MMEQLETPTRSPTPGAPNASVATSPIDVVLVPVMPSGRTSPTSGSVARLGPTAKGVAAGLLNPGAWIFFATTASALIANATSDGGTGAALAAAVAMAIGVSCSDLTFTILGSGGRRLFGERGLRWIRMGLAALLVVIGVAFVTQAIRG